MKVRHPVFAEIVRDVADAEVWLTAGWVPVDPPAPKPRPRRRGKYPLV